MESSSSETKKRAKISRKIRSVIAFFVVFILLILIVTIILVSNGTTDGGVIADSSNNEAIHNNIRREDNSFKSNIDIEEDTSRHHNHSSTVRSDHTLSFIDSSYSLFAAKRGKNNVQEERQVVPDDSEKDDAMKDEDNYYYYDELENVYYDHDGGDYDGYGEEASLVPFDDENYNQSEGDIIGKGKEIDFLNAMNPQDDVETSSRHLTTQNVCLTYGCNSYNDCQNVGCYGGCNFSSGGPPGYNGRCQAGQNYNNNRNGYYRNNNRYYGNNRYYRNNRYYGNRNNGYYRNSGYYRSNYYRNNVSGRTCNTNLNCPVGQPHCIRGFCQVTNYNQRCVNNFDCSNGIYNKCNPAPGNTGACLSCFNPPCVTGGGDRGNNYYRDAGTCISTELELRTRLQQNVVGNNVVVDICSPSTISVSSVIISNINNLDLRCVVRGTGGAVGDNCILDGQGNSQILQLGGNNNSVRNLKFQNGMSTSNGGAIYMSGSGQHQLIDCTFTSNQARGGRGGAAYIPYGDVAIINCQFNGNSAQQCFDVYANGQCRS